MRLYNFQKKARKQLQITTQKGKYKVGRDMMSWGFLSEVKWGEFGGGHDQNTSFVCVKL